MPSTTLDPGPAGDRRTTSSPRSPTRPTGLRAAASRCSSAPSRLQRAADRRRSGQRPGADQRLRARRLRQGAHPGLDQHPARRVLEARQPRQAAAEGQADRHLLLHRHRRRRPGHGAAT
ncbi:MAG: hypothetical protein MZW92_28885 [Comamonadaceae bacterium]|nr:hypothetical protein [Comamonadaceae bacterium]